MSEEVVRIIEKQMKDLNARLMPFISPGLEMDGKITIATSKAVLEVTNVSTVVINEDAVDDLRVVLADRFDDLVEVQVKHKAFRHLPGASPSRHHRPTDLDYRE